MQFYLKSRSAIIFAIQQCKSKTKLESFGIASVGKQPSDSYCPLLSRTRIFPIKTTLFYFSWAQALISVKSSNSGCLCKLTHFRGKQSSVKHTVLSRWKKEQVRICTAYGDLYGLPGEISSFTLLSWVKQQHLKSMQTLKWNLIFAFLPLNLWTVVSSNGSQGS